MPRGAWSEDTPKYHLYSFSYFYETDVRRPFDGIKTGRATPSCHPAPD